MTTDELMEELAERGLSVVRGEGGPRLRGDRAKVTPTLLAVLRWHRAEIEGRLGPAPEVPPAPPASPMDAAYAEALAAANDVERLRAFTPEKGAIMAHVREVLRAWRESSEPLLLTAARDVRNIGERWAGR